ncbi:MAG: hypothetical protein HW412_1163 [Bacteroidetes bacterium]|nr:hypothetical protein [Bacteroidota bacterium]
MKTILVALLVLATPAVGAQKQKKLQNKTPVLKAESWLQLYNLDDRNPTQFNLPRRLSEASGLAFSPDGRLFCHNDELGIVFQVNYTDGSIVKQFSLGRIAVRADFEGIAIAGEWFYLASSNGNIYEFKEGKNSGRVSYEVYKTPLNPNNDVEGLEYDGESRCLLLACKGDPGKGHKGYKAVYAFSLADKKLIEKPRLLIPLSVVVKKGHGGEFNSSGIAKHPKSGTYFVISANGGSIIEITEEGDVLAQKDIPQKVNEQPEGIAFAPDLSIIICNDMKGGVGKMTVYPLLGKK